MGILLSEHREINLLQEMGIEAANFNKTSLMPKRVFPSKLGIQYCYTISEERDAYFLKADYYVGVDWIIQGERFIQVKPKLNTRILERFETEIGKSQSETSGNEVENKPPPFDEVKDFKELDYLKLLLDAFQHSDVVKQTDNLVLIDWNMQQIEIEQKDDALTPFLVVQFLNMLRHIVRKGLKKAYYKIQENLNNRIKGKILLGANIKQNVLKNRLTKTYCEFQQFGIDHPENRFLKKVFNFCRNYVRQNAGIFAGKQKSLELLISYCEPAFELVGDETEIMALKNIKHNPFFKEYKEAIKIGEYILKRFAYNISNTSVSGKIKTPPFWIDMPKLFELYVYHHLLKAFSSNEVKFQFATYGNVLDFLITKEGYEMVVDAKYKMQYRSSHIHEDIRQVAGYARLNKVYEVLGKPDKSTEMIKCLIVYPCFTALKNDEIVNFYLDEKARIKAYREVYKIGIPLPYI